MPFLQLCAALRTTLSDLNTAALAPPGRLAARGALEERGLYISRGDLSVWMSALRCCAGAQDQTPGWRRDALPGIYTAASKAGEDFPSYRPSFFPEGV